jgi:hypothetical protein
MKTFFRRHWSYAKCCKHNITSQIREEWESNVLYVDGLAMGKDKLKLMRNKLVIMI